MLTLLVNTILYVFVCMKLKRKLTGSFSEGCVVWGVQVGEKFAPGTESSNLAGINLIHFN